MRARKSSLPILFLLILGIGTAQGETIKTITMPPETATFDSGTNVNVVENYCLFCHSADYPTTQPLPTANGWQAVVDKMRNIFGAAVPSTADPQIVDYLVSFYGCRPATISGFWPGAANANQAVFVFGQNFKILHGSRPLVRFNGIQTSVVQLVTDDMLFSLAPSGNTAGPITVENDCSVATSSTNFGTVSTGLSVNGLWPSQAHVNDPVLVFGAGFNPQLGATKVDVNGTPAWFIQTVDSSFLMILVPAGATTGPVHVTVGGVTVSSPTNLVILP
jgi:hypothetical protein